MENELFEDICKYLVSEYFNNHKEKTEGFIMTISDVFIVWSCKTLQNNKAMVSTKAPDGMYYEVTYNGDKKEIYLDAYKKWENTPHKLEDVLNRMQINSQELKEEEE